MPPNELGNTDDLNLDLNVTNQERWAADLQKAKGMAEETAGAIGGAFSQAEVSVDTLGTTVLQLSKRIQTLSQDFQKSSTKDFGADLEFVNIKSREAVTRLAELKRELIAIEELNAGKDLSKGGVSRLTEDVRTEIALLERELLLIKQLQTLQAQSIDPRSRAPITGADAEAKNLLGLQATLRNLENGFVRVRDINISHGLKELSEQSVPAIEQIRVLRGQVLALDKALLGETKVDVIQKITREAVVAEAEIAQLKRQLISLQLQSPGRAVPTDRGGGLDELTPIARGLGLPDARYGVGGALAVGVAVAGIYKFVEVSKQALDRNRELLQSQRALNASASEMGVTYGVLADKNAQYAEAAGLSIQKTTELTQKVAQLVSRTAQPDRFDKTVRSLLDLGAARGLDAQELVTVTNQIITGQDEAYKKLGIKNPQILYKEFAEAQGRSVESLSQLERQRIYQDEILRKAQLFSGAAKSRLEDVDGQVAKTSAAWENMLNNLSQSFAGSQGVFDFLDTLNQKLKDLGITADDTREKLSRGVTPASIGEQGVSGPSTYGAFKGIYELLSIPNAIANAIPDTLGRSAFREDQITEEAKRRRQQGSAFSGIYNYFSGQDEELYQYELTRRANATLNSQKIQEKVAAEERKRIEEANAAEDVRRQSSILEHTFDNTLKRKKYDADAINKAYKELLEQSKLDVSSIYFSTDKLETLAFKHAEAVSNAVAHAYDTILRNPHTKLAELQRQLLGIGGDDQLTKDDQERLTNQYESAIKTSVEKIQGLTKQVRDTTVQIQGKDNPFVKIFSDMETALDRAQERFGIFGKDFVEHMAEMEKAQLRVDLAQARFLNNLKQLDYEQQAQKLKDQSYQQQNGFQRNLAFVGANVNYVSDRFDLQRQVDQARFFAQEFNPYNPRSYNESKYGYDYQDKFNPDVEEALKAIAQLNKVNLQGTGVLGQGVIADALLKRIPGNDVLLSELYQGGGRREDAEKLLNLRYTALQQKQAAEDEKFAELIRNQVFAEQARRFAQQKVDLLNKSGVSQADQAFAAQQTLNITGELGPGELTADLRSARLQALNVLAEDAKNKEKEATERMNKIATTLESINDALTKSGVKIDTATTPLLDVNISNSSDSASATLRPGPTDVARRNRD